MPKFREIQAKLTPACRELLDFIWERFQKTNTWPSSREVYARLGREKVLEILRPLDTAIIRQSDGPNGQKVFELPLLGILSTSKGETYQKLLRRYLDYVREIYYTKPDTASIKHTDVQAALKLNATETAILGRLVFLGFLPSSGGYQPDFSDWGQSLPAALEDMPSTGDLLAAYEGILDQLAANPRPVLVNERVAMEVASLNVPPLATPTAAVPAQPMTGATPPLIFMSYSHDTRDHKMWVLELAQRLHTAGIEVILDQWDLRAGDDAPKFMERSVQRAERVLMICTESYVTKVNEGKGGAGYEGMIVTGELVRDQGGAKFIPIIRQNGTHLVPACVNTRTWINLSPGAEFEAELKKLIIDLRKEPPPTKPPRPPLLPAKTDSEPETMTTPDLSSTPSAAPSPAPETIAAPAPNIAAPSHLMSLSSAGQAYQVAMDLARASDLVTWRKIVAMEKQRANEALLAWRQKTMKTPPKLLQELPDYTRGMVETQQSLFAIAAAGVESGQPKFNHQAALVYDLLKPSGWERDGYTYFIELPQMNAFVFHALIGAMAVYSNQNVLAIDLATQRIADRDNPTKSAPLFLDHGISAWPSGLNRDAKIAWNFLWELPNHFSWITTAFGSTTAYRECMSGYFLLLSWLEFLTYLRRQPDYNGTQKIRLEIPPMFVTGNLADIGARRVLQDRAALVSYAAKQGIPVERQVVAWKHWIDEIDGWLTSVYHDYWTATLGAEIRNFAEDVHR